MTFQKFGLVASIVLGIAVSSCEGQHMSLDGVAGSPGQGFAGGVPGSGGTHGSVVDYEHDIQPLFQAKCAVCHNSSSVIPNWLDYNTASAKKDKIYDRVVVKKDMPKIGDFPETDRALVAQWIQDGAVYSAPQDGPTNVPSSGPTNGPTNGPTDGPSPGPSATVDPSPTPTVTPAPPDEVSNKLNECVTCHNGYLTSPMFPHLFGQPSTYIVTELNAFKSHARHDQHAPGFMYGPAKYLDDSMILGLALYFEKQKPFKYDDDVDQALAAKGRVIFENGLPATGVPACMACHGANGEGQGPAPRLAGQWKDYVVGQIQAFKNGDRGEATMMPAFVNGISEDDAKAVGEYVQQIK